MNPTPPLASKPTSADDSGSEILVLSDGRIFAHNITPAMAQALAALNPGDEDMRRRANPNQPLDHEVSD